VHKIRPKAPSNLQPAHSDSMNEAIDRRIAEIIPGIADLSLSPDAAASAQQTARQIRIQRLQSQQQHANELLELESIYDMSLRHPVDLERPAGVWQQDIRPNPRRIVLSSYQAEMINYQRMLMRKNIWYYRDRMSVPRGPCPLHVLKDCWVQGVIDEHSLVWGHGLYDWLPVRNVKLLTAMIRTPEGEWGGWGPVVTSCSTLHLPAWPMPAAAGEQSRRAAPHLRPAPPPPPLAIPCHPLPSTPRPPSPALTPPAPPHAAPAVRFGAWFKRTFSLKPALERIRERRRDFRTPDSASQQIERMR